jgi:hypothetical protein
MNVDESPRRPAVLGAQHDLPPQNAHPKPPNSEIVAASVVSPNEVGGRDGPDPTRYGDWELRGRCIDF